MNFWYFMVCMTLLIPITMIGFGKSYARKAPDEISYLFGYRTKLSMLNRETWEFAHKYIGRLWNILGWLMVPVSIATMFSVMGYSKDVIGTVGGILTGAQCVLMILPIIPTEIALKRTFDKDGNRK